MAAVAFVALLGAAGFRAAPGVLMVPLQDEFGWSRGTLSLAVSVNLVLFGLTAPFAAALMDRFGHPPGHRLRAAADRAGSGLTVFVHQSWQLVLTWGVLVGLGTGSMALVFAATVANRWFVKRRGLVTGILTAGSADRPADLPAGGRGRRRHVGLAGGLAGDRGGRAGRRAAGAAGAARPARATAASRAYGADEPALRRDGPALEPPVRAVAARGSAALREAAAHSRTFWALVGGLRDLRRHHQRADRHPLRPGRARPRHGRDRPPPGCSPSSASSTSSAPSPPAG